MEKKNIKRKEILKWLEYNKFYPEEGTLSEHVYEFYGDKKYRFKVAGYRREQEDIKGYLIYGLEIFEEFLKICKKNEWTNDFIPTLKIYLKDGKSKFKNYKLTSMEDLVKDIHLTPPEICLRKKIWGTYSRNKYCHEYFEKNVFNEFCSIFNKEFPKNYQIYYWGISYDYEDEEGQHTMYQRTIYVQYNENNSETVSDVKELTFKK